jgi:hypothetical protein
MRWIGLLLWTLVVATAGYGMFQIKFEVQALESQLSAINGDIREREESIRVLRAEWSYLNEPDRLATLAARYLELAPAGASQLVRFEDLPLRPAPGAVADAQEAALPVPQPRPVDATPAAYEGAQ